MSVAVAHMGVTGFLVIREVIRSIRVWDAAAQSFVTVQPGTILRSCRIRRHSSASIASGAEPYVMEFEAAGAQYECALATFQPRTRAAELNPGAALAV